MPVRRSKFAPPTLPQRGSRAGTFRTEIFQPDGGIDTSVPKLSLRPGSTDYMENFEIEDGELVPRSQLTTHTAGETITAASDMTVYGLINSEPVDREGDPSLYLFVGNSSSRSIYYSSAEPGSGSWSELSYASSTTAIVGDTPLSSVVAYNPATNENFVFIANGGPPGKIQEIGSVTTFSEVTEVYSFFSEVDYVTAHDDRLVWFSSGTGTDARKKRVVWSTRGKPLDYANGGLEDLVGMKGSATGITTEDIGRLVLFSDKEVWQGRARRDEFAFDFEALTKDVGAPYSDTIVNTPAGIMWLAADLMIYRLQGGVVRPVGSKVQDFLRDRTDPQATNAQKNFSGRYDPGSRRYMLWFRDTGFTSSSEGPEHAVAVDIDSIRPARDSVAEDDATFTYHNFTEESNSVGFGAITPYYHASNGWAVAAVEHDGTTLTPLTYSHLSTIAGLSDFTSVWESHPLRRRQDAVAYDQITELHIAHEAESLTTLNVSTSTDLGGAYTSASTVEIDSGTFEAHVPVSVEAARHPRFRLQIAADDAGSRPTIGRIQTTLRSFTGRRRG